MWFAAFAVMVVVTGVLGVTTCVTDWRDDRALEVANLSGQRLAVYSHTGGMDWYTGDLYVDPRSTGTLRSSSLWARPDYIYISEMAFPQRHWRCDWKEVSDKGGLLWTDDGANCGERQ